MEEEIFIHLEKPSRNIVKNFLKIINSKKVILSNKLDLTYLKVMPDNKLELYSSDGMTMLKAMVPVYAMNGFEDIIFQNNIMYKLVYDMEMLTIYKEDGAVFGLWLNEGRWSIPVYHGDVKQYRPVDDFGNKLRSETYPIENLMEMLSVFIKLSSASAAYCPIFMDTDSAYITDKSIFACYKGKFFKLTMNLKIANALSFLVQAARKEDITLTEYDKGLEVGNTKLSYMFPKPNTKIILDKTLIQDMGRFKAHEIEEFKVDAQILRKFAGHFGKMLDWLGGIDFFSDKDGLTARVISKTLKGINEVPLCKKETDLRLHKEVSLNSLHSVFKLLPDSIKELKIKFHENMVLFETESLMVLCNENRR